MKVWGVYSAYLIRWAVQDEYPEMKWWDVYYWADRLTSLLEDSSALYCYQHLREVVRDYKLGGQDGNLYGA